MVSDEVLAGLMNLHDVFLDASLMADRMGKEPLERDVHLYTSSDRARFERLWVALLAVLIESWHSANMRQVRAYVNRVTDTTQLVNLLRESRRSGYHAKMVECRHYMFHRDQREYWDDGRKAPLRKLKFNRRLHAAFGKAIRTALNSVGATKDE